MNEKIKIYGDPISGNCYKIKLLCSELGIDYDWHELDILSGATRTADFLKMNPNGKIPLLELPDGRHLAESNAILCYLAEGTVLAGADRFERATVLQWMFFEQYSHEPYVATSRFIVRYLGNPPERWDDLEQKRAAGERALGIMELKLRQSPWMTGDRFTLADIALFAYTHVAEEGGFHLERFPGVMDWIARTMSRPNYKPMYERVE
ncbi:MAG TPA: glutathione S-transferase family protein [Woeseiaceae bacterium]|nr:glutathione S-transferase family protein [Woeseiaceae bacterium]